MYKREAFTVQKKRNNIRSAKFDYKGYLYLHQVCLCKPRLNENRIHTNTFRYAVEKYLLINLGKLKKSSYFHSYVRQSQSDQS